MNLTLEQKHIIKLSKNLCANEILAIQACAGSGKTTTLREIALANPNDKFLYLAFNKAIVCESKKKFPKNVDVRTIHSIAFVYAKEKLGDFRLVSKLNRFDLEEVIEFEDNKMATNIIKLFDEFLRSDKTLEYSLPNKAVIEYLYESALAQKIPITHNFYLKFYQLSKDKHLDYDFVLLDEAQDSNAAMISVFLDNHCKKILVGDTFQNIYGFNDSINAFEVIRANHYATLSQSFRCTQPILDYANFLLKKFANKPFANMTSGFIDSDENSPKTKAFITRTNAGIVKLIYTLENPQDFCLLKEPNKIFAPIWAILHFRNAKFSLIPREYAYLKRIKNNKALYAYIANSNDLELQGAMKLLEYDMDLREIMQLANNLYHNKKAQNFILNAHQAKGLEWDSVEICDDFPNLLILQKRAKDSPEMQKILEQELHLFYVAITRAKKKLVDNSLNYSMYNLNKNNLGETMENLKVLGFDIGVSSIGWAFVEGGELKDCGVRIFTKAENPKDGSSLALPRREARGVRRRLARRKGRLNALKVLICEEFGLNLSDYLANAGELPKAYIADENTKSPYQLRAEALERKLSADEFARVILHIAKHRGYGNKHAKESSDEQDEKKKNEQKGIKSGIAKNNGYKNNYQTIGAYLYNEFYCKERVENKKRNNTQGDTQEFVNVRNRGKGYYERCLKQDWLKEELEIIFVKQREFGLKFSDDFRKNVLEIVFLQRPLKSFADKVGKCTFFADEPRAPKDSLSAIEFVALTRIINTLANITKRSGEVYSADKVREILNIVLEKGEITYKNLRKVIALDDKLQFPKDSKLDYAKEDAEKAAKAIEFRKLKAFRKALGGSFEGFSRAELDAIATYIALIKSKDELKATLSTIPSLNEMQVENLSELSFDKFIDLSFKALEAILPLMRGDSGECKRYDEAWREAGLKEVAKSTYKGDSLPPLIEYEKNLANPVVARALAEYRKVLNALLKKYGKVHKIHLEFTRQAGVSSKERGEIIAEQNKRLKANEEARKLCEQYGLIPSGKNILKLKLWQEQGEYCVYSGGKITQSDLSDDSALQIDHIYPYSRSYDDSQNNKVLVFTSANQDKLNQTPYEAFGKDIDKWNRILGLIQKLPKAKKNRITNKNFADKEAGFIARNIVDTSYIATLTASYTNAFIEFCPLIENEDTTLGRGEKGSKKHITVVNGSLTATMRHYWGLNTLLDSEDSEKKDRSNHLHHALDAIIIAYTSDSIIKAFSVFKKTQEQNKARLIAKEIESAEYKTSHRFFSPSNFENNEEFRQAIKRKILGESTQTRESRENDTTINSEAMSEKEGETIKGIFVSKPPRKRARGALHKETFSSIDDSDLAKTYGGKEGVKRAIALGKVRQIGSKIADNGAMVRVDIFRHKVNGKFYGVPIYTMDFALGVLPNKAVVGGKDKSGIIKDWLEMDANYEFCFSLFKDDLILVQKKEMSKAELCYYKRFKTSGPSIEVAKHDNFAKNITPNQEQIFKLSEDRLSIEESMIAFQNLKVFEKWQVSPLGEVSKAEFREREPISLKSTPKSQKDNK